MVYLMTCDLLNNNRPPAVTPTSGFTLIELVMTMIILSIISIMVMPRFADQDTFAARGFYDQTLSLLRYAQKTAIAQHHAVCVSLHATGVTLTISNTAPCDTVLPLPAPQRTGSGLSTSQNNFKFLASGATDQSANISISIAGSDNITVAAVTGHVY